MKYCKALHGTLNIERDRVHLCCVTKHHMPSIPWDPDTAFPIETITRVRHALLEALNKDMDRPVLLYEKYGEYSGNVHPCKGCRFIEDVPDDFTPPPNDQLHDVLQTQAFTYCNARCIYCDLSVTPGRTPLAKGKAVDKAVYRAVNQLLDKDMIRTDCQIRFSSGEPSLSEFAMQTLDRLVDRGQTIMVNTNAIKYSPEIARALNAGNTTVQISIDSGNANDYKRIKCVDQFESVKKNILRYQKDAADHIQLWIKYIVFSETNSQKQVDSFIDFCVQNKIRHVSLSVNHNEGEDISQNGPGMAGCPSNDEKADPRSLRSFGYLGAQLELKGVDVHTEFAHMSDNEQRMAKKEYAKAVIEAISYCPENMDEAIKIVSHGMDMARKPEDGQELKDYWINLLKKQLNQSNKIALYSAGAHGKWVTQLLAGLGEQPIVILDKNPGAAKGFDCPVVHPKDVASYDADIVIIASTAYHLQILLELKQTPAYQNFNVVDPYLNLPWSACQF